MMRLALTLVTLLLAALSAGASSAGAQPPPIRIGFASAMSGPAAITGEGVRWGATLAVEEINATTTTALEAGMVFCVETPYYEHGWGGVQVEDAVEVTPTGVRTLTRSSQDLAVVG